MSNPTKLPGIGKPPISVDAETRRYLEALSEALQIRLGLRGDPIDRAITLRELIDSGLAVSLKAAPFDPNNPTAGNSGFGVNDIVDTTTPPVPTNFEANGAYSQVNLSWDYPRYSNHSFSEIYGHDSDVIGNAQLIGVSTGRVYIDPVGSGVSRYYWIRHVSQSSVLGPWNSGTGTLGQTATDVAHQLAILSGAITSGELATNLQTEINKISGDINVAGSIATQVADEATARATAVSNEAAARATAVSGEAAARATAISNSADALQAQLNDITGIAAWDSTVTYSVDDNVRYNDKLWSAEAAHSNSEPTYSNNVSTNSNWELTGDYTSLGSVTAGNSASITAINNVSSNSTSAAAVAIKALQTTVTDPNTGLSATAGALTTLSSAVNHTDTGLSATAGNLTSLETAVFNDMTGVADWNGSTTYAVGDKVISGKKLYRATAASTDIVPPNSSYWVVDTLSSASAISALSTTLTDDYATADATNLLLADKEDSGVAAGLITTSEATAAQTYATATTLTNLESATFGNLTGLSAYNEQTTYAVGDRVTHGVGVLKKIYVATQASSASSKQAPTVPAYWDEDTLASLAVTNAALGGKETSGAAAQVLQASKTYTDENAASASDFTALNTAVFEDVAGVDAWDSATAYAIDARVYFGRKIYRAVDTSNNVEPGTNTNKWLIDPAASASALTALDTKVNDDYTTSSDLTGLLALKISADQSAQNIAQAITNSETTAGSTYATAANLTSLESSIYADLINVSAWVGTSAGVTAVDYVAGNFVTHDGKLFKALAASTNVEPGTNAAKWEQDTLTTADQVESAYAKSSDVSVLQSNIFNSMTGVADWSATPTYAVGDRVVYTEANGVKKLYKALIANSDTTPHDNISGSTPKWALDTLASALAVDSLTTLVNIDESITNYVGGQFTGKVGDLGNLTVAAKFNQYRTASSQDTATVTSVDAAYAAIFTEMTGLPDWDTTTTYAVGARVVHRENAASPRKVYKALVASTNVTPHNNITGSNPKWELDTLAFAGALDTLDATVNADGTGLVHRTSGIESKFVGFGTSTIQQVFDIQADDIGNLSNQFSVKIDANGAVAGFGLGLTTNNLGISESEFIVNADRFAIMRGGSDTSTATVPFAVQTVDTTLNGESVLAGVYMADAFIKNGSIANAKIGELNADKITTGFIDAGRIEANTLDASKIVLDNSTITSGTVNGVPAVIIKNLGVDTAQINSLAVKTVKIDDQAVTIPDSGGGSAGIGFTTGQVTLATMTFTSSGAPIFINASSFVKNSRSDRGCSFYYRLYRGPTKLVEHNIMITAVDISSGSGSCAAISYLDNPGAGNHVYRLKAVRQSLQAGQVITAAENWITGLEVKK